MEKDLIDFYEEKLNKNEKDIEAYREIGDVPTRLVNKNQELNLILKGLYAEKEEKRLNDTIKALRKRLKEEGIEVLD